MRTLPQTMIRVLAPFAPLFSKRVIEHVRALLAGAILAPGTRTVSSALRAMGEDRGQGHLPLPKVRSSHSQFVKASALRWVCVSLLAEIPLARRVWALPFLCVLAYSERYAKECGKRHKSLTEWAFQLLLLVRRWYPKREIVAVADGGYGSLKLLDRCRTLSNPITFITRLRLDALPPVLIPS